MTIQNVLDGIPYEDAGPGKRKLVDEPHLLMMQIALKPGQAVPEHQANSNVHLFVIGGDLLVTVEGKDHPVRRADLLPVAEGSAMSIRNEGSKDATFLVCKTPRPTTA
jgi:quercetin dioxygenase-like cupin family protein